MSDTVKLGDAVVAALEECLEFDAELDDVNRRLDALPDSGWAQEPALEEERRLAVLSCDEARIALVRAIREAAKPDGDDE